VILGTTALAHLKGYLGRFDPSATHGALTASQTICRIFLWSRNFYWWCPFRLMNNSVALLPQLRLFHGVRVVWYWHLFLSQLFIILFSWVGVGLCSPYTFSKFSYSVVSLASAWSSDSASFGWVCRGSAQSDSLNHWAVTLIFEITGVFFTDARFLCPRLWIWAGTLVVFS